MKWPGCGFVNRRLEVQFLSPAPENLPTVESPNLIASFRNAAFISRFGWYTRRNNSRCHFDLEIIYGHYCRSRFVSFAMLIVLHAGTNLRFPQYPFRIRGL